MFKIWICAKISNILNENVERNGSIFLKPSNENDLVIYSIHLFYSLSRKQVNITYSRDRKK
jgi:hypothetical protein